jgi:hypothetical protein
MSNLDAGYLAVLTTLILRITVAMPAAYREHRQKEGRDMPTEASIATSILVYLICVVGAHIGCTAAYVLLLWLTS